MYIYCFRKMYCPRHYKLKDMMVPDVTFYGAGKARSWKLWFVFTVHCSPKDPKFVAVRWFHCRVHICWSSALAESMSLGQNIKILHCTCTCSGTLWRWRLSMHVCCTAKTVVCSSARHSSQGDIETLSFVDLKSTSLAHGSPTTDRWPWLSLSKEPSLAI